MIVIALINSVIIYTVVVIHYECLLRLNRLMPWSSGLGPLKYLTGLEALTGW